MKEQGEKKVLYNIYTIAISTHAQQITTRAVRGAQKENQQISEPLRMIPNASKHFLAF